MKSNKLMTIAKGVIVGGTMLVPGVSGGSMALILGIYHNLISSISSFLKKPKQNILFLALFVLGSGTGMILFAQPILSLIERYPIPMLYFFIGAVAGGVPMMLHHAEVHKFSWKPLLFFLIGAFCMLLLSLLPSDLFSLTTQSSTLHFVMLVVAGIIAAVALVLPGVSVSYLLLLLGLYNDTMSAISETSILFLIPLGIGLLLGMIATTKLLEHVMSHYPKQTYMIILGFIFGSMIDIFPGIPQGSVLLISFSLFFLGFCCIYFLSSRETLKHV